MDKLIYLLWGPKDQSREERRETLLRSCGPELLGAGVARLTMYIADPDSNFRPATPLHKGERICAEVALWVDSVDSREPFEAILRGTGFRIHGYLVDECIYTEYGSNRHAKPRDWPDGQRSPGVVAVTLMERPKRLSHDEWIKRWHGRQSPTAAKMQPQARYIRNVVVRPVTQGAPPFEGIVEEAWPSKRHVTNPFLFYGAGKNPFRLAWNMIRMVRSVRSFLDIHLIRTTMMSEYIVQS
jgi:hypothetical protein